MDQNATTASTTFTPEYREKVFNDLAQVMLGGLDSGEITIEQSKEISQFVLDHLDAVNTQEELIGFLNNISTKWPIYKSMVMQINDSNKSQEKIEEIKQNISQINNQ